MPRYSSPNWTGDGTQFDELFGGSWLTAGRVGAVSGVTKQAGWSIHPGDPVGRSRTTDRVLNKQSRLD